MPAKDVIHDACIRALIKDGWTVTHEPLTVKVGETDFFIDAGAERVIAAERGSECIAVEMKSFLGKSSVQDLKVALGRFILYEDALRQSPENADRILFLAVRDTTFDAVFSDEVGKMVLSNRRARLVVFNGTQEVITQWIR